MAPETKLVEFRKSHPIDFSLLDHDDQAVMYISEDKEDWALHLTIANTSSQAITLADGQGAASGTNHHFALRFRPGTLSKRTLGLLTTEEFKNIVKTPWALAKLEQPAPNAKVTLYLLYTGKKTLAPNEKLSVELSGISAAPGSGSRGTQVELIPNHKQVKFADQTEVTGSRTQYLHVTNHSGRKNIPLHVAIVEGNRVLNGDKFGQFTLRITNVFQSKPSTIMLRGSGDSKTKLVLSYDAGEDGWALAKTDAASNVQVVVQMEAGNTLVTPTKQGETPQWEYTFDKDFPLESRQHLDITIFKLAISEKPGTANLYLRYENIPGYWDGQFVCTVEKGPFVVVDGNVGIGTSSPLTTLQVGKDGSEGDPCIRIGWGAGIDADRLTIYNSEGNKMGLRRGSRDLKIFAKSPDGDGHIYLMPNDAIAMSLLCNGNVGIGTKTPKNALDIKGSLVIGSKYAGVKKIPDNGLQVEGDVIFDHDLTVGHDLTVTNGTVKSKSLAATSQITGDSLTIGNHALDVSAGKAAIGSNLEVGAVSDFQIAFTTGAYTAFVDQAYHAEICNETKTDGYKALMICGNRSRGGASTSRWVQVYDNLEIGGDLFVSGILHMKVPDQTGWQSPGGMSGQQYLWLTPSDLRFKSDLQCLHSALGKVRQLRGVTFSWNEGALQHFTRDIETTLSAGPNATEQENQKVWQTERDKRRHQLSTTQVGVVAQDVESVLPEAVTTDADGYKLVRYDNLIPLLIEAIKEQDQLAARQQTEIEQLKQSLLVADTQRQH